MPSGAASENRSGEAVVVCSIREADARAFRRSFSRVPAGCGLVELRADDLPIADIAGLVKESPRPAIVTLRRTRDGGGFGGAEEKRSRGFRAALDAGARFVDIEHGSPQQSLLAGADASRVVLSHHGAGCSLRELRPILRSMASSGAARLKIVPDAESVADALELRRLLEEARGEGIRLAAFAQRREGSLTRLMAPAWGSWATYGALRLGAETAPGQFTASDLLETFDVLGIGGATRFFLLLGNAVSGSPSPAMHRAAHHEASLDARYLPLELDALDDCLPLLGPAGLLPVDGLAVTIPFKEIAAERCSLEDEVSRAARSVNTVLFGDEGWRGFNTDGPAMLTLIRRHLDPAGAEAAIVGAGGTARAAAAALHAAGCRVTVFNRTLDRAQAIARSLGGSAEELARLPGHPWDVLVQATPLGTHGERILTRDAIRGRIVLDAVYGRETPLVADARANGLAVADGLDLLVAQAVPQFERMTGIRPDEDTMRDAALRWLAGRGAAYLP